MLLAIHEENISQLIAHIEALGETFFHGDGNMFTATDEGTRSSDNHQKYSNPKHLAASYRAKFTSVSQVPGSLEELEKMLLNAKNQEIKAEQASTSKSPVTTFDVKKPEPVIVDNSAAEAKDAELADLKAELEQMKKEKADKEAADEQAAKDKAAADTLAFNKAKAAEAQAKKEADAAKDKADKEAALTATQSGNQQQP